jgi:plastocyanin
MKFDITKLPVLEAVIGFLLVVTVITFVGAFAAVNDGESEESEDPGDSATATPGDGGDGDGGLSVVMDDNFFDPDAITVPVAQEVTINLTNEGSAIHNMQIAGADNEYGTDDDAVSDPEIVNGGDQATVTWLTPDAAGEIDFRCEYHPDQMTGTITVQ